MHRKESTEVQNMTPLVILSPRSCGQYYFLASICDNTKYCQPKMLTWATVSRDFMGLHHMGLVNYPGYLNLKLISISSLSRDWVNTSGPKLSHKNHILRLLRVNQRPQTNQKYSTSYDISRVWRLLIISQRYRLDFFFVKVRLFITQNHTILLILQTFISPALLSTKHTNTEMVRWLSLQVFPEQLPNNILSRLITLRILSPLTTHAPQKDWMPFPKVLSLR